MKDKFILYRDPEDILFAFEKKEEFMYPHLFIEANDIKVFCASRKYREMQRKVQRLAATFLNLDFGISRR